MSYVPIEWRATSTTRDFTVWSTGFTTNLISCPRYNEPSSFCHQSSSKLRSCKWKSKSPCMRGYPITTTRHSPHPLSFSSQCICGDIFLRHKSHRFFGDFWLKKGFWYCCFRPTRLRKVTLWAYNSVVIIIFLWHDRVLGSHPRSLGFDPLLVHFFFFFFLTCCCLRCNHEQHTQTTHIGRRWYIYRREAT